VINFDDWLSKLPRLTPAEALKEAWEGFCQDPWCNNTCKYTKVRIKVPDHWRQFGLASD